MEKRIDIEGAAPGAIRAMSALHGFVATLGLEPSLLELIRMRGSQINGCAYCLDMHSKDARARGETEQRLYTLSAWRETPFFTPRERAVLAFTEAVSLVADSHIPDDVFNEMREHFSEAETVGVLLEIIAINAWNRYSMTQRTVVGDYVSPYSALGLSASQPVG